MFFNRRERREILVLNVIPLIDISAMIIIFLVMGSVFGETSILIPPGVFLPKSNNKEQLLNAPQVTISKGKVTFTLIKEELAIEDFSAVGTLPKISQLKAQIKNYISKLPKEDLKQGVVLNIVATKTEKYKNLFDVLKVFRESGFQSILFLSQGN